MSSDLYVYGAFTFPKNAKQLWEKAELPEDEEEDEDQDEMGVTFRGTSELSTVAQALKNAEDVYRFLELEDDGDSLVIRGVLGDDDWYPWTTTLGAMARAAALVGATGHLEVLDDGSYIGRLSLQNKKARFDGKAKQQDRAGEKALLDRFDEWLAQEEARYAKKKAPAKKPAKAKVAAPKAAKKLAPKPAKKPAKKATPKPTKAASKKKK